MCIDCPAAKVIASIPTLNLFIQSFQYICLNIWPMEHIRRISIIWVQLLCNKIKMLVKINSNAQSSCFKMLRQKIKYSLDRWLVWSGVWGARDKYLNAWHDTCASTDQPRWPACWCFIKGAHNWLYFYLRLKPI